MNGQPNQSVQRGLAALAVLTAAGEPIGSRELARRLGDEHTRTHRMLRGLVAGGFAIQDGERRYRPGPGVHLLAARALHGSPLLRAALPVLRELHLAGQHMALGLLWDGEVSYLYHGRPSERFDAGLAACQVFPAEQSSIGQMLEALGDMTQPRTPRVRLAEIRRLGYAHVHSDDAGASLAVPVMQGGLAVAGLARVGRSSAATLAGHVEILIKAARAIAQGMESNHG
jgi:DNA-binding IclR family transcriptional regulator